MTTSFTLYLNEADRQFLQTQYQYFTGSGETGLEYEFRLRSDRETKVSYDHFSAFYSYLESASIQDEFQMTEERTLDIRSRDLRGVRITIRGVDAIRQYCNTNRLSVAMPIEIGRKRSIQDRRHDIQDYGIRFALSQDQSFPFGTGFDWSIVGGSVSSLDGLNRVLRESPKEYRFKQRYSFQNQAGTVRYDLTIVKEERTAEGGLKEASSLAESGVLTAVPTYEVEWEILPASKNFADVEASLLLATQIYQSSLFPIARSEERRIMHSFLTLSEGPSGAATAIRNYDTKYKLADLFPGGKVVSIQHANLKPGARNGYIFSGYNITDKADGERALLFIDNNGVGWFLNNRLKLTATGIQAATHRMSILDGEAVISSKDNTIAYYAFDILADRGQKCVREPFYVHPKEMTDAELTAISRSRYERLRAAVSDIQAGTTRLLDGGKRSYASVQMKQYFFNRTEEEMRNHCRRIWEGRHNRPYELDGLIFTPNADPYKEKRTWDTLLKWKPMETNSIDFLVRFQDQRYHSYTNEEGQSTLVKCQVATLFVSQKNPETNVYEAVPFQPDNTNGADTSPSEILIPLNEADVPVDTSAEQNPVRSDTIIECVWSETWKGWKVMRTRLDKTELYIQRGRDINNTANYITVAMNVWASIVDPITIQMLVKGDPEQSIEGYYTGTRSAYTTPMNVFHNHIKGILIRGARGAGDSILDLSSGRGGDLYKWRDADYRRCVGLDISRPNIESSDTVQGSNARLEKMKREERRSKRVPRWATRSDVSVHFLCADTSIITTSEHPNGILDEKDRELAQDLLSEPFSCISSMFSAHYYFKNKEKIRGFFQNLHDNCAPDGYVIITCTDAERIFQTLRGIDKDNSIHGKVGTHQIWEIQKKYSVGSRKREMEMTEFPASMAEERSIAVQYESIGMTKHTEYLVHRETMLKYAQEYGFELPSDEEVQSRFGPHLPGATNTFDRVRDRVEADLESIPANYRRDIEVFLTDSSQRDMRLFSSLSRYYILKRTGQYTKNSRTAVAPDLWRGRLARSNAVDSITIPEGVPAEEPVLEEKPAKPRAIRVRKDVDTTKPIETLTDLINVVNTVDQPTTIKVNKRVLRKLKEKPI